MKKRLLMLVPFLIAAGLAFPIINLIVGLPPNRLTGFTTEDELLAKASAILAEKCVHCHTTEYHLPYYAKFPVAKQMIEYDIHRGTRYMDYLGEFFPGTEGPVSEVALAKTEYSLEHDTMPPFKYLIMHWNHRVSAAERETLLTWLREVRKKHYATPGLPPEVQARVIQPLPQAVDQDPRKVALGNKLFDDKHLSKDNTLACSGCHGLDKGGTDQRKFSVGVGDAVGDINAPTVYNAGYQFMQFWDGRAATLEEQADGPVNNPIEMASNWQEATVKLEQDAAFTEEFLSVYPDGYKMENFVDAIAAFERTLVTPNSAFDKYLMGDENALTPEQKQGYALFLEHRCATCHVGPAMGGQSFELMGREADYFADRGNAHKPDYGRFNATSNEADRYKLKVPTLRNIALTHPYLHDASTSDLEEVVQIMAKYQVGNDLSHQDAGNVAVFLAALTGEYNGELLQ